MQKILMGSYFVVVYLMSWAVYRHYPAAWKDRKWKRAALITAHTMGFLLLEGMLSFLYLLPSGFPKTLAAIIGTLYFAEIHLMFFYLVISWFYALYAAAPTTPGTASIGR